MWLPPTTHITQGNPLTPSNLAVILLKVVPKSFSITNNYKCFSIAAQNPLTMNRCSVFMNSISTQPRNALRVLSLYE